MASITLNCHLCHNAIEDSEASIKHHLSSFHVKYWPYSCTTCYEKGSIHKEATEEAMEEHIATSHGETNSGHIENKDSLKEITLKRLLFCLKKVLATKAKEMRRFARLCKKQRSSENEDQREPIAKKIRSDDRISNIAAIDNGTMMETFKYLNYCQLATSSLVSKRFWNLIQAHRHKLALLDVNRIYMYCYVAKNHSAVIRMFNEELSPDDYNKLIARNGYWRQISLDSRIAGKESTEIYRDIYDLSADVYQSPNREGNDRTTILDARVELKNETWPLFQHFNRLLMDPFIYIRTLSLNPKGDILLAGAMNPERNRLHCKELNVIFDVDSQNFIVWIKTHVRCDKIEITVAGTNYDEELLDLFLTGAPYTSAIKVTNYHYDLSKVIVDLVQKFTDLKNHDEYQVAESIQGNVKDLRIVKKLKRNFAKFIAEEEQYEEDLGTRQIIRFINNDIEKKLSLNFGHTCVGLSVTITNL